MARSRHAERQGFDTETRLRLIEGDLDTQDETLAKILNRMERSNQLLTGLLISVTTASILMLINVLALGK